MAGGAGNDRYVVDNVGDRVVEAAGGGADEVVSSVTFVAGLQEIEAITLGGAGNINALGNALANTITGNAGANRLIGAEGDDTLDGGAGADRLEGGAGDDAYVVDNAGDRVVEAAGAGSDRVSSSVSFVLPAEVEALRLTGSAALFGFGNALANAVTGNDGANRLHGRDGADTLDGGLGSDRLYGGAGADLFVFLGPPGGGQVDRFVDFVVAEDRIGLGAAGLPGLAPGPLDPGALALGTAATTAAHRLIYDGASGWLLHDADGVGGAAAVGFAILPAGLALTAADVLIL
jgi:Ca2+-binding RTX toxin-like protein